VTRTKSFCLSCGRPCYGSRCPEHTAEVERSITARKAHERSMAYGQGWQKRSIEARRRHVAEYGLVCPGWSEYSGPHQVESISDLCLDHGPPPSVMCRKCNSSKAGGWDKRRRAQRG
jgi:hypothetical protein